MLTNQERRNQIGELVQSLVIDDLKRLRHDLEIMLKLGLTVSTDLFLLPKDDRGVGSCHAIRRGYARALRELHISCHNIAWRSYCRIQRHVELNCWKANNLDINYPIDIPESNFEPCGLYYMFYDRITRGTFNVKYPDGLLEQYCQLRINLIGDMIGEIEQMVEPW